MLTSSKLHQILTLDYYSREEDDDDHHVVVPVIIVLICSRIPIVSTDLLNMLKKVKNLCGYSAAAAIFGWVVIF